MNVIEAVQEFEGNRRKEGSHVALLISLGDNGMLQAWLAGGMKDETYATMLADIVKWANDAVRLHRPQGRA